MDCLFIKRNKKALENLEKENVLFTSFEITNSVFRSSTQNSQFRCVGNKNSVFSGKIRGIPPHPPILECKMSDTSHYLVLVSLGHCCLIKAKCKKISMECSI